MKETKAIKFLTNSSCSFGGRDVSAIPETENVWVLVMLKCLFLYVKEASSVCDWGSGILQCVRGGHWWRYMQKVILKTNEIVFFHFCLS
jgi:hypothetical protein